MTAYVDASLTDSPVGLCVVLPGREYSPAKPLLDFATQAALQNHWAVRQVWWEPERLDDSNRIATWAARELAAAVEGHRGRVLLVAKSLGVYTAGAAAAAGYDAIWLTPVLTDPLVKAALASPSGRQLVVGGTGDRVWDSEAAGALPGTVVEVPDADHSLRINGDVMATMRLHTQAIDAVCGWISSIT